MSISPYRNLTRPAITAVVLAFTLWSAAPRAPAKELRPLALRGVVTEFPFWLGTTMYNRHWEVYKAEETAPDAWWYNRAQWTRRFEEMQREGLSALAFTHPHPYPALISVPGFKDATWFDAKDLARSQKMFRWIIAEGKRHGVSLYFLTWNICLPPRFARAHGLPEFGADTPLTRAYTRAAVAQLFRTYPDLGGLITMAAETPPGCVDFVVNAICGGLRDSGVNPTLIFWPWCAYPADARRVMAAYPNTRLMHYLQYEQLFAPRADPRIGRFSAACNGAPMVALGGPKSAEGFLFWGDPDWARRIVRDLCRQNGDGLFIETYCAEPWLAQEAFAYYAQHPNAPYAPTKWEARIGAHYHNPALGAPLLEAMSQGSRIIPRFLVLVHSQSDHFMPQMGLPLVYYLEMPTLSSYVFENVQTIDAHGFLRPNLGLCWPNPNWGENVVSIKDFARGNIKAGATTPLNIADELDEHAARCADAVQRAERIAGKNSEAAKTITLLRLDSALGRHFAAKIRAAIAWQRFKLGHDTAAECRKQLAASVTAWEEVARLTNRLYPKPLTYWRSELASAPPWTQNQIWKSYAQVTGHWRDQLEPFRRELALVSNALKGPPKQARLPLWEELLAAPPDRLKLVFSDDFKGNLANRWVLGDAVRHDSPPLQAQNQSGVTLDSRNLPGKWHMALTLKPGIAKLTPGKTYQLSFEYTVITPGHPFPDAPFAVAARSASGRTDEDIGSGRFWTGVAGARGKRIIQFAPKTHDDYAPFFSLHGQAAIVIRTLRLYQVRQRPHSQ